MKTISISISAALALIAIAELSNSSSIAASKGIAVTIATPTSDRVHYPSEQTTYAGLLKFRDGNIALFQECDDPIVSTESWGNLADFTSAL